MKKYTFFTSDNKEIVSGEAKTGLDIIEKLLGRELRDEEIDSYEDTPYGKKVVVDGTILRTYKLSKTMRE